MLNPDHIRFFHSFELPDGKIIKGARPIENIREHADMIFKYPVKGKSVLDIGAWDGFYSFDAERRGASRVMATDHHAWTGSGWGTKDGFNYVHEQLGSRVESQDIDVFGLDPLDLGVFDVVIFCGVLYHLKDMVGGLSRAASVTKDLLIVETLTEMNHVTEPAARYYVSGEHNNDTSNFWGPNAACVKGMLKDLGFKRFESWMQDPVKEKTRLILHAWR